MDLRSHLSAHSHSIYETIDSFMREQEDAARDIDRYLLRSVSMLRAFTMRGGKAIRPYLGQLAYDLAGGGSHQGLLAALGSIELHHKHILILDDIADRDESRYGGPTLEHAYRTEMTGLLDAEHKALSFAMLDGVLLGAFSKELLLASGFPSKILLACLRILNTTMYRDTLAGWQIHGMQCTQKLSTSSQEEFIKGLHYVTASYTFAGPLNIGLSLAKNTNRGLEEALSGYAANVGTAFQIQDDILGLFGKPEITGKPVGNDVREGKKTLLLQEAYKRGSVSEKAFLEQVCGKTISADALSQVQQIVEQTGSLEYSKSLAKDYVEAGIQALHDLPDLPAKSYLIELAFYIINREK